MDLSGTVAGGGLSNAKMGYSVQPACGAAGAGGLWRAESGGWFGGAAIYFNWFDNSIVVNANGERVLGPGRDGEYTIWEDCYGQQRYILAQESVLAEYELGFCGRPWLISEIITVYDLQGAVC